MKAPATVSATIRHHLDRKPLSTSELISVRNISFYNFFGISHLTKKSLRFLDGLQAKSQFLGLKAYVPLSLNALGG